MHIRAAADVIPKACTRPRATKWGHVYADPRNTAWQNVLQEIVASQLRAFAPFETACAINAFAFTRAKITAVRAGDADNILKNIMDALTGVVYLDDSLVVDSRIQLFQTVDPLIVIDAWTVDEDSLDRPTPDFLPPSFCLAHGIDIPTGIINS